MVGGSGDFYEDVIAIPVLYWGSGLIPFTDALPRAELTPLVGHTRVLLARIKLHRDWG